MISPFWNSQCKQRKRLLRLPVDIRIRTDSTKRLVILQQPSHDVEFSTNSDLTIVEIWPYTTASRRVPAGINFANKIYAFNVGTIIVTRSLSTTKLPVYIFFCLMLPVRV